MKSRLQKTEVVVDSNGLAWISEPRDITFGMWVYYMLILAVAPVIYFFPPKAANLYVGEHVMILWPIFWVLGGLIGALVTLQGWWGMEKVALAAIASGAFLYLAYVGEVQWNGDSNRWGHLSVILSMFWLFWYRWRTIYLHDINPEKA